ncbi:MAG TPA: SpoVR family protein, partial [Patescibacteria group bacterium]|nr:SpoVR family protein [Patescibacteria group bacterium]
LQCQRNMAIKVLSEQEQRERALADAAPPPDPFYKIHQRPEYKEPDLKKIPIEPDENILLFIRDHNPYLTEWERDLLTIVHEEAQYFIPQIETKIMNEGWATFWHKRIVESLNLPQELHLEFLVKHAQVVRPHTNGINPYHIGLKIWENIEKRYDETPDADRKEKLGTPSIRGKEAIFRVRESDRDASFIRRHLNDDLIRELDLFAYYPVSDEYIIGNVGDEENSCNQIRSTLIKNVGMNTMPVIRIDDADFGGNRVLHVVHDHDGRDLLLEHAEKTLRYLFQLWGREVVLETIVDNEHIILTCTHKGVDIDTPNKKKHKKKK